MKRKKRKFSNTIHSVDRFKQRSDYSSKQQKQNVNLAMQLGYKISVFTGDFFKFLCNKQKFGGMYSVRVYENFIYIYDTQKSCLVTVYAVPERFLPVEKYLHGDDVKKCIIAVNKTEYVTEGQYGYLTDDIALATEFRTEQKAVNYIKNNKTLTVIVERGGTVDIISL